MASPDGPRPDPAPDLPEAEDVPTVEPLHAILDDPEAFERRAEELRRRRSGFPDRDRPLASLLEALVWFFKLRAETTLVEADAGARRPMGEVLREEQRLIDDELDRARAALPDFEAGIHETRWAGPAAVAFDSRDPDQDRIAGTLITYLVSTEFATVRTEELPGDRYRYHIAVDWPRLDAFAARLGLPTSRE
jgi:hypothetical protein